MHLCIKEKEWKKKEKKNCPQRFNDTLDTNNDKIT